MLNEIQVLLGGYVAEKVVFGEQMTSGASNDLYRATQLASRLVRRFGMGNSTIVTTNTDAPDDNFGFCLMKIIRITLIRKFVILLNSLSWKYFTHCKQKNGKNVERKCNIFVRKFSNAKR